MKGGDSLCSDFERDAKLPWVHELVSRCLVCLYWKECGGGDERTMICHGYHHVNKRNKELIDCRNARRLDWQVRR